MEKWKIQVGLGQSSKGMIKNWVELRMREGTQTIKSKGKGHWSKASKSAQMAVKKVVSRHLQAMDLYQYSSITAGLQRLLQQPMCESEE